jgi:proteasome accessory factor A
MQWERVQFSGGLRTRTLDMGDLFDPGDVRACAGILEAAHSGADAVARWNARKDMT